MSRVDKQQIVRKSDEVDISEQIRKTIIFLSNKWEEKNQEFDINLDKFYQCEESHKKQGNGLGLSIVKRIIELLDGEIYCESELGVGTSFYICLKIAGNI